MPRLLEEELDKAVSFDRMNDRPSSSASLLHKGLAHQSLRHPQNKGGVWGSVTVHPRAKHSSEKMQCVENEKHMQRLKEAVRNYKANDRGGVRWVSHP